MNILSLIIGRDGCSGYRVIVPLKGIKRATSDINQTHIIEAGDSGDTMLTLVSGANIILFRQQHDKFFHYLKNKNEIDISNKVLAVDFDDDIFNITPFSETYRYGGVEEVEYNGKKLWKDGESGFDIAHNKKNLASIIKMMKEADLVTVTTPYLKKRIEEISGNKNVVVLPNALNFTHWKKWELKKDNVIRIGWSGGSTHYIDWFTIKDGIKKLHDKYGKKIKLVLSGCKWDGTLKDIPHEYHEWLDFDAHPYKQASLNLDIAIIPLKENELFNKSKSCIKWYEYSALGIPCVVSDALPYNTEVEHNKTGLLYKTEDEFVEQVSRLIDDQKLRYTIGENARQWVHKNRDVDLVCFDYLDAYQKALDKKLLINSKSMEELEPVEEVETSDVEVESSEEVVEEVAE